MKDVPSTVLALALVIVVMVAMWTSEHPWLRVLVGAYMGVVIVSGVYLLLRRGERRGKGPHGPP